MEKLDIEELVKKVDRACFVFFFEEKGNKLTRWSWGAFQAYIVKIIREHKKVDKSAIEIAKSEKEK